MPSADGRGQREIGTAIAIAGYFPDPTLSGSYGFASNVVSGLIAAPNNLWSVGATAIAMLCHTGRLKLGSDVTQSVGHALEGPKIELLPFTPAAASRAAGLGGSFPGDPADRFIVASALERDAPLVTKISTSPTGDSSIRSGNY